MADADVPDVGVPLGRVRATLDEPRPYRLAEVAEQSGLDEAVLDRLFRILSRDSHDGSYGDADVTYARDLAVLLQYAPLDVVEREARMRIRLASQLVVNDLATVRLSHQISEALDRGITAEQLGEALAAIARDVVPAVGRLLAADHRQVLLRLLDSEVVQQATRHWDRPTVDMAVGFVDLVGFTRLSAAVDPEGLGAVLTAFETLATDVARELGDVLVAKTIGDAVMLVSGSPDHLATALLRSVLDEPAGLEDVRRRGGFAYGEVIVRDGDYVGTTVNIAARLTDLARPGSVVADADTVDRLGAGWQLSRLPPVKLKGLGTARPYRVRPADVDGGDGGAG